jgi:DNA-binding NtrC family response regulator
MDQNIVRMMLVDDDKENGTFLEEFFSKDPYRITWWRDPRVALQQFRRGRFQVAILDYKMPGMTGLDLFRELREKDPDLGVIMVTGYPNVDNALEAIKTGIYDYVKKPYKVEDLKIVVNRLLEEKGFFLKSEMRINQKIGMRIKEFRVKKDWTLAKLAAQTNLSKSLLSQIENAKNSASLVSLVKIARSLNVKSSDLVQDL